MAAHHRSLEQGSDTRTRASHHFTPNIQDFTRVDESRGQGSFYLGDGSTQPIHHSGSSILSLPPSTFLLNQMFHIPTISKSLLSVHQFSLDNNCYFEFHPLSFVVKDQTKHTPQLQGVYDCGLYRVTDALHPQLHLMEKASINRWYE